jgi:hypothetical protein
MKTLHALLFVLTCALTGTVHAGYYFNGICHASHQEATWSYYDATAPSVYAQPGVNLMHEFAKVNGVVKSQWYQLSGGSWVLDSSADVPVKDFPYCDPAESFVDGMIVGWGVASVFVAAAAIALMQKAAK